VVIIMLAIALTVLFAQRRIICGLTAASVRFLVQPDRVDARRARPQSWQHHAR